MTMTAQKKNSAFTAFGEGFFACALALLFVLADTVLAVSVVVLMAIILVVAVIIIIVLRLILIKQKLIQSPER